MARGRSLFSLHEIVSKKHGTKNHRLRAEEFQVDCFVGLNFFNGGMSLIREEE